MANRFTEFDEFHLDILNHLSSGVVIGKEGIVRNPEKVEIQGSMSAMNTFPADARNAKSVGVVKVKRKRRAPKVPWRKPLGMPKRPLSAYNLFFQSERERLIECRNNEAANEEGFQAKTCGIGFANLAKNVASKWKTLDSETKAVFQARAAKEKQRYKKGIEVWKASEKKVKDKMQDEKLKNSTRAINPLKISSAVLRRTSDPSLLTEPLYVPSIEAPSMQRRVTFSSMNGMTMDNHDDIDTVFEDDLFLDLKPTKSPLRSQSDSFLELRSNSINSLSCDAPAIDRNRSLLQNEGISSNIFRFMKELFVDLDDDEVQFITALNHP